MKYFNEKRAEELGEYIAENNATVRAAAKKFGISKSTVHKDVTERLKHENTALFERVRAVLDKNKAERHVRGGEATKQKYLSKSSLIGS
jgi:putative DeoR family transcriptional regulator (stage III sporulation protein D)